ncbi:phenylalanine--tRNA ligase subunit alpha [Candidatus Campbellbacteria bacterium]|nr:MAG: phenylalanine--tRNA ligase subunit alpha [Candidatus Campbellbacteria bacterium]
MSNNLNIDVTAPGKKTKKGGLHIITKSIREMENIFAKMGFEIFQGVEAENEFYNFDAMNVPKDHPARDMQDTFWIKGLKETVLRTHTSEAQVRYMEKNKPPFKIIVPGRVFRNEATDATHEAQFHQLEGLVVGEKISLSHLKTTLLYFLRQFFENENLEIRIRPGYFPFVEPGIEVDVTCFKCKEKINPKCNVCKGSGFIEVLGAGMVHPNVLEKAGVDGSKYQGFAFGPGVERLIMLKYGVEDIRDFYDGDIPFLKQF